jgi:hypothetical protein
MTDHGQQAGLIYAFANTAGIVSFNTISEIMTDDPYNWSTGPTGLMFLAALVGSFIGCALPSFHLSPSSLPNPNSTRPNFSSHH